MKYRVLTVLLLSAAGCSGSATPQGEVSGTVSYRGQPLPGGIITFVSERGLQNSAVIGPDGHYRIKTFAGPAKVTINNQILKAEQAAPGPRLHPPTAGGDSAPRVEGTYVPLPTNYLSADQSGLTCDVQKGTQIRDFALGAS
jgi:hypothetical protein